MNDRDSDPDIDIKNPDNTEDQLEAQQPSTTMPPEVTDTEFGEDPDIETSSS